MSVTPNLGLQLPPIGSNNWGVPLNYDFAQLDAFLSGGRALPALTVAGDVTIGGTVTAGAFAGLDGTFLTSALFNQPNGIPQLNGAGKIPPGLLPSQGISIVAFSATPVFNAQNGSQFKITLTGNVTSSTFTNGATGPGLVAFRVVQDGTGGRVFTWPANVRNAGEINDAANAVSIQLFAPDVDGSLDSVGPMQYS
jgi:hypothetical protein